MSNAANYSDQPIRWLRVLFLSAWAAAGIGMASLKWDASIDFSLSNQDYEFKDNTLDKQRVGLNRWLIVGYSSLAFLGVASVAVQGRIALPQFRLWHLLPVCLLLWCGSSFFWSVEPSLSMRRIGHMYMAALGGFGMVAFLDRREILWGVVLIFSSLCLIGIVAESSLAMFHPWRSGYRFCGVGHPNETALFAVSAILASRVLWLLEQPGKSFSIFNLRNLAILCVLFNIAVLLLTKSRTTLLAGAVAVFVMQYAYSQSLNGWIFAFSAASAALMLGLYLATVPTSVFNAFFGIATIGRTSHIGSLTGRIPLWEEILKHWQQEPTLGYGYGGYWTTRRVEDFAQLLYWEPPNGHSIYIDSLVETGPIGLALLVATVSAFFIASFIELSKAKNSSLLFVTGVSAMIMIHGLAESSFFKGCFGPMMFALSISMLTAKSQRIRSAVSQPLTPSTGIAVS